MRDKKMMLLGIMSFGLVGTWAYHIYDKTQYARPQNVPAVQPVDDTRQRDSLRAEYASTIRSLDERLSETRSNADSMRIQLEGRVQEISKLKSEINAILQNASSSGKDLEVAQYKIGQLQSLVTELETQKGLMEEEKKKLSATMNELSQRVETLTADIKKLDDENKVLTTRVNEASVFVASSISLSAVTLKNNREVETGLLKKAFKLIVSFDVHNQISDYENADVFVVITQPDGQVLKNDDIWESTTTSTASGSTISYSRKIRFDYAKGETKSLLFSVTPPGFQPGTYQLKLYHKGVSIGESKMQLK